MSIGLPIVAAVVYLLVIAAAALVFFYPYVIGAVLQLLAHLWPFKKQGDHQTPADSGAGREMTPSDALGRDHAPSREANGSVDSSRESARARSHVVVWLMLVAGAVVGAIYVWWQVRKIVGDEGQVRLW